MAAQTPSTTPPHFASASLYIGDLQTDVTEAVLYEIFHIVGPVSSIRVCRDSVTRKSLGYAYVNYHNVSDAERALDTLNFHNIKGNPCRIMWSHRDPALRKTNVGNVFVKNLDRTVDNKALYDTFSMFGNILSCKVAIGHDGKSQGYGFIHFEADESAKAAIGHVNGMLIGKKEVFVGPFVRKTDRGVDNSKFTNVYIKNFPATWDEDKLRVIIEKIGPVSSMAIKLNRRDQGSAPFAFANFESFDDAQKAVTDLNDRFVAESGIVETEAEAEVVPSPDEGVTPEKPMQLFVGRHMSKNERAAMFKRQSIQHGAMPDNKGKDPAVNLYIKNLADEVDDNALRAAFEEFGTVVSAKVMRNQKDQSRGFGFVSFENKECAPKAVTEMHLKMFFNKPLYVGLAEKREQRFHRLSQRYRIPPMRPNTAVMGVQQQPNVPYAASSLVYQQGPVVAPQNRGYMNYQGPPVGGPWRGGPNSRNYPQQGQSGPGGASQVPIFPMGGGSHQQRGPRGGRGGQGYRYDGRRESQDVWTEGESPAANLQPNTQLQKQQLGEKLFPKIQRYEPQLAGKITGMMLEMDTAELVVLLESEAQLKAKVDEALRVLEYAQNT